jgi:hypothetical protein
MSRRIDTQKYKISKSSFLRGVQCEKSLYLHLHHPELRDEISETQEAIFTRGTGIGILAQQLFPGGIDAKPADYSQTQQALEKTRHFIESGMKIIYEAAIQHRNAFAFIDILVNEGRGWHLYEVKSSSSIQDVHVLDAAFQLHLLIDAGFKVNDVSIIHLNTKYVRKGELKVQELFSITSVYDLAEQRLVDIDKKIQRFEKLLKSDSFPGIPIGPHCYDPYECDFMGHCWQHVPDNSVFEMGNLRSDKKFGLYNRGIVLVKDIPDEYPLSESQRIQVQCERDGKKKIDRKQIHDFLGDLNYPLYFFDLETFNPAVPLFDNSRPYQQIPFQFSIHYKKSKRSTPTHREFLAEAGPDPRPEFIGEFLKATEKPGDILVYNRAFEAGRLRELARDYPEYANDLDDRIDRIGDLMIPFRKKAYYTPGMRGSYSIKAVLPELVPDLTYEGMVISEGGAAMNAYEQLIVETDRAKISEARNALLAYCKLDTLGMVRLLEELEKM